jgi:branched-chain amino acid transport system ATP-binding protein
MAIASAADCLLLDEPSAGLAETTATEVFEVIRQLGGRGVTLIVAEQDPKWLAELVNRTVQLEPVS